MKKASSLVNMFKTLEPAMEKLYTKTGLSSLACGKMASLWSTLQPHLLPPRWQLLRRLLLQLQLCQRQLCQLEVLDPWRGKKRIQMEWAQLI